MNTVALFSGCGGLSLGFKMSGFNIVAAFDNWYAALEIYKLNFNHDIYNYDLSDENASKIIGDYQPDLIIAGPPCQDFSSAGKRDEGLGRANLTVAFARIIEEVQPSLFVMENVDRIIKSKALKKALNIFRTNGYGLTHRIINAAYCNTPQHRKRFILIGEKDGRENALGAYLDNLLCSEMLTVYDYMGDILDTEYYYRHPRSYNRRAIFSIYEPSPTIRGVNRPIPKSYKFHPGDAIKDLSKVRPLTTIERSYIQTFPRNYKFEGSKTNLELMIGNSVPVNLAKFVAAGLKKYLNREVIVHVKEEQLQIAL